MSVECGVWSLESEVWSLELGGWGMGKEVVVEGTIGGGYDGTREVRRRNRERNSGNRERSGNVFWGLSPFRCLFDDPGSVPDYSLFVI